MSEFKDGIMFGYGQWSVLIMVKDFGGDLDPCCSINCTGNWYSTQGMLYSITDTVCAYNEPEILPKGLKALINKRAHKLLGKYLRSKH